MIIAMQGFVSSATSALYGRGVVFDGLFARWACGDFKDPDILTNKSLLAI